MNKVDIFMDESGLINKNEVVAVYGGVYFTNDSNKKSFKKIYKKLVLSIKCKYCKQNINSCNKKCPELKHYNLKPKDKRRFINLIKKLTNSYCVIIETSKLNKININDNKTRNRYKEYCIKMIVKEIIKFDSSLNKKEMLDLLISVDQQSTTSNGIYDLETNIKNELLKGITNIQNYTFFPPLLKKLQIQLKYCVSSNNYLIQASDIFVGSIRKKYLNKQYEYINNNCNILIVMPEQKKNL